MKKPQEKTVNESREEENERSNTRGKVASGIVKLGETPKSAARVAGSAGDPMRALAAGHGIQALWASLMPLLGVGPASPGEFPGLFQVEPGPGKGEAMIHIDIPNKPYESGRPPSMDRVVTLSVRMEHDFRKFGDRYYCIDCEVPADETQH